MIVNKNEIKAIVKDLRKKKKIIVFTNGVFDILHKGHVYYLNKAKELGDILVVGVNSDSSVKRLKGKDRPVNILEDRMYVLDSLRSVDYTVAFEEDTPINIIKAIEPDVLVKGGDYDADSQNVADKRYIVGSDIVKKSGGKVKVIDLMPGRSTTGTIKKLREYR
ncbi:MAG: D-glycero-beta-D-manno-heptose 1-phosphate adenylyltransferase [Candidatus Delongbacteria bacterium]